MDFATPPMEDKDKAEQLQQYVRDHIAEMAAHCASWLDIDPKWIYAELTFQASQLHRQCK